MSVNYSKNNKIRTSKPLLKSYKSYNEWVAAVEKWNKRPVRVGTTKTTRRRGKGGWITTTMVWNGSKWVAKKDYSKVPNRVSGTGKENNPDYGKKNNLKINKEEKKVISSENKKDNESNKVDTKTAFNQDKPLVEKKDKNKEKVTNSQPKKYGNAPKGYIKKKKGKGFVSIKSPRGKQLAKIEERKAALRLKIKNKKK